MIHHPQPSGQVLPIAREKKKVHDVTIWGLIRNYVPFEDILHRDCIIKGLDRIFFLLEDICFSMFPIFPYIFLIPPTPPISLG